MTDDHDVRRHREAGRGVEQETEAPAPRELAGRADDRNPGRYPETIPRNRSIGRFEPFLERHRQNGCWKVGRTPSHTALKGGVCAQGRGQASIEKTVVGVAPDVTGVAEGTDKGNAPVDTGGHAQQLVVGEMTDDDFALPGLGSDRPKVRSEMCRASFTEEDGFGPLAFFEPPFEVATADEEQLRVDPGGVEGAAVEFGHGPGAGPLVGENNYADSHVRKVIYFSNSRPTTSDVGGGENLRHATFRLAKRIVGSSMRRRWRRFSRAPPRLALWRRR